jgi:N6-L-threonylcarbamoyladenine synthase
MEAESITLLAIESSCDDTSAAIIKDGKVLANIISTQSVHAEWGGIVPELASRAHQQNIIPAVDKAFKDANVKKSELNAIAYTGGPGLMGSLMVGGSFAKAMALALNIPTISVHHMKAHILAHFINDPKPNFPFICLTVSGGHTQLVLVNDYLEMEVIGTTIDDAAGEAFDKCGKIFGLSYPGGPLVDQLAKTGNPDAFQFSEPKVDHLDFSFSGLKTSVLYFVNKSVIKNPNFIQENLNDLCASLQKTIVNILIKKLLQAAEIYQIKDLAIAGGVSANSLLRSELLALEKKGYHPYIPEFEYCLDNAGMIAITGYYQYLKGDFANLDSEPRARWAIDE